MLKTNCYNYWEMQKGIGNIKCSLIIGLMLKENKVMFHYQFFIFLSSILPVF